MKDIENKEDLHLILQSFYEKLLGDPGINYIFIDIAKIDLEAHLLDLTDFWEQLLFNTGNYNKNVMQVHLNINNQLKFTDRHFEMWLDFFNLSIDENFSGLIAENMKTRALSIATVMKIKMKNNP